MYFKGREISADATPPVAKAKASVSVPVTDTDAFAFATGGVASALISLPLKYMHTTVESAHIKDVQLVIELIYHSLLKIKNQHDFKYIK